MRLIVLGLVILALTSTVHAAITCNNGGTADSCVAGEYCTLSGTDGACLSCPAGTWRAEATSTVTADEDPADVCTACDLGTTSTAGSDAADDCTACSDNLYGEADATTGAATCFADCGKF